MKAHRENIDQSLLPLFNQLLQMYSRLWEVLFIPQQYGDVTPVSSSRHIYPRPHADRRTDTVTEQSGDSTLTRARTHHGVP